MRKDTLSWLGPVLLALALAAALWFFWARSEAPEPELVPDQAPADAPVEAEDEQPEHPLAATQEPPAEQPELRPLPPLGQSDEYFKLELDDLFGERLSERLVENDLIERIVATVDNLPRDQIAERIRPMTAVPGQLLVREGEEEGEYYLDPANYERYEPLVSTVTTADTDQVEEAYRRFYPLMQKAYTDLGYPDDYFNDRVIEVIDHLLETPEVDEPIRLVRPHVFYEFADPGLEELSPGQKLLLRMGGDNASAVKLKLRELRDRISANREEGA
ncbi:MAG: DUF3014 domain-containing protein [Woeseia sp.]